MQSKSVLEATSIVLALTLLSFGIAGFHTLFTSSLHFDAPNSVPKPSSLEVTEIPKKNLLTYLFPDLKYSCTPEVSQEINILWSGTCHSVTDISAPSYSLKISSPYSPKKYKGFKLAKEVFYLMSKKDFNLNGKYHAFSVATFLLGGGTFIKVPAKQKKNSSTLYLFGLGLGLAFHIDKKLQLEFQSSPPAFASVN